jgi:acyl transferase domain-containing protein/NAD(P)H-dependent flavin oxidoreductase YrpB (nitropropane dioxygenase family)/NAD(P)-dependent dehydrogenase (short-subunit alcohol dehydrogenase family)
MKVAGGSRFRMMVLSPGELVHPGLAIAAARSGGVGLIDFVHCTDSLHERAAHNLKTLIAKTAAPQEIGLRIRADQLASAQAWLALLAARRHVVIVSSAGGPLAEACKALRAPERTVLAELGDDAELDTLERAGATVDGVVACGREAAGWVGSSSTFVLLQRLIQRGAPSIYVRGIAGPSTLASCRVAGIAGAVLDDLVLLMPESPLPREWQSTLAELDGLETAVLGEYLGAPCRVLQRPTHAMAKELAQKAQQLETAGGAAAELRTRWQQEAGPHVGWASPHQSAWPVGQAVGAAAGSRDRSGSTGGLLRDLLAQSGERLQQARDLQPLAEGTPLAKSHGTRFPIVQGPMTRVSDTPAFAEAVARGGGLPLLALALMRGEQARPLLEQTRDRLAGLPWGIGILGFVPPEIREEQTREMMRVKPPFALIAGGRPEHAEPLEQAGIRTYLHVPAVALLKAFLQQGARRFVFEGRESGGHVGPLGSFPLWEAMVETLLREVPAGEEEKVHVLFAGGIHDALSGAMVSALAAPLAARGMRIGVLMGTAYMFTAEAVASGAILPGFQRELLTCTRTITLESGLGHSNRCAVTPFTDEFVVLRRQLLREGRPAPEIKQILDDLSLGRLRVATRGLVRTAEGLVPVDESSQRREGMYMAGEVATLRDSICTVEELHRTVAEGSRALLAQAQVEDEAEEDRPSPTASRRPPAEVAIIGMGLLLPKAQDTDTFWQNLLHKVNAITEVPSERWDWRMYFDPDRKAPDKSYSRWGGFADELVIDPIRFGIPPNSMKSISPSQVLVLELVRRALEDAGYEKRPFDREHTAVIIANADSGGYLHHQYVVRTLLPMFEEDIAPSTLDRLPEWTEETFPGTLANVHAGRVANRFDLGGPNYIVDSACASSLTAVDMAVAELESGRSNMAIVGGMDTGLHPYMFLAFSKTQALSPTGRARCFDKAADGIVISEGSVMMILKRLKDAERDGDRIYAVIKGVGASSDGKAMGLTAPRPLGQQRALRRAYEQAGFSPSTLGLYEAHGTGTSLGDRTEVESLTQLLRAEDTAPHACVIGSAKSLLGHTKTTAGMVGIAKAALALYHRVLPPHAGVEQPLDPLVEPTSPVYLLHEARPWLSPLGHPRRSGISAFGFGGTNTHAVLEEYTGQVVEPPLGGARWPVELVAVGAKDRPALIAELRSLREVLDEGASPALPDLAYTYALRRGNGSGATACFVTGSLEQLKAGLRSALEHLEGRSTRPLPPEIVISSAEGALDGKVAFLFPGQGAQQPDMAREPALFFDELRASFEHADGLLRASYPLPLSHYVYPPASFSNEARKRNEERLTDTHVAQPAIGVVATGFFELLTRLGLRPDMVAGHSYGEYAALHAAGVFTRDDFLRLSEVRGQAMARSGEQSGAMAAVHARREEVEARLSGRPGVVVAGHNAPKQTILSGETRAVKELLTEFQAAGVQSTLLPVSGAFHSPLMRQAQAPLAEALSRVPLNPPRIPVYANASARPYGGEPAAIRAELQAQLLSPVRFVEEILQMYADGARVFVEMGPGDLTTQMVRHILADKPHLAVALEPRNTGLRGVLRALAELTTRGIQVDLSALFRGRNVRALTLSRLVEQTKPPPPAPTAWRVNGMYSRPIARPTESWSKLPPLTSESPRSARPAAPAPQPVPPMAPVPAAAADAGLLTAYQAYQDTMQQFLRTQEEVMRMLLGGGQQEPAPGRTQSVSQSLARTLQQIPSPTLPAPSAAPATSAPTPAPAAPTSRATPAPATPALAALEGREALTRRLVSLVSERTGYPQEMLRVDQDLEAELGIDSIKRVEILDAFIKALPSTTASKLRSQTEQLTRSRTLSAIVELTAQLRPEQETRTAAPPPEPSAGGTAPVLQVDREALQRELVELVAQRTGYPPDMIGPRQDMEAELGIDSIKRVEILGMFQKRLPPALANMMRSKMDELGRARSLAAILDLLLASIPPPQPPSPAPARKPLNGAGGGAAAPAQTSTREPTDCPRFVMRAIPAELPWLDESQPLRGLYLLTSEEPVGQHLAEALQRRGAQVALLDAATCASREQLERSITQLRAEQGPITGILHLVPLELAPMPTRLEEWRRYNRKHTKLLFQLLKLCGGPALRHAMVASRLGGTFGRNGDRGGLPTGGGPHGLLKTYQLEQKLAVARSVDFDPSIGPDEIARHLVNELLHPDPAQEVGYLGGCRHVFAASPAPLSLFKLPTELKPEGGWVVLVTGGARGITAEITRVMAQPGMKLILVGRTPEPEDDPPEIADAADAQVRELWIRRELRESSRRPPAVIEHEVQELLRKREIRRNLQALREAGAQVEYHGVDVADEARFGALLDELYERHGRLDAVLHGAGMIADKLVADKSPESFDRVFDTKVDSAFILYRRLRPETLRLMMLFGSTAGRFGNPGQGDYSAANEVLNRMAWRMSKEWTSTRVISVNWGPWHGTGMARDAVNLQFLDRGIKPISVQGGCHFALEEIRFGGRDAEVIAGLGPWAQ